MRRAAELYKIYQRKVAAEYEKRKDGAAKAAAPAAALSIDGKTMYIDKTLRTTSAAFSRLLRERKIKVSDDRLAASVFVVPDVVQLPQRVHWCLALGGGVACDMLFVNSMGSEGRCMAYEPACHIQRVAWASPDFVRWHPELHKILVAKTSRPSGMWTWPSSQAAFLAAALKKYRTKRWAEVVAF